MEKLLREKEDHEGEQAVHLPLRDASWNLSADRH
jgi:hypothetical protein